MDKWEYKVFRFEGNSLIQEEDKFNDLGRRGWELVCCNMNIFYFKRRIPQ